MGTGWGLAFPKNPCADLHEAHGLFGRLLDESHRLIVDLVESYREGGSGVDVF